MAITKFLDPKNDLSFKRIFGSEKNKKILIHFLNDILGFSKDQAIEEVEFLSTILDPEIASDKQSIVDVLCKDAIGNRFVIEMQLARDKGFEKRAQLYAAKAYARQLDKSGNYINLKKVFFIAISNCNLFPEEVGYLSTHSIRDIQTNGHYLKDFQFIFIELPKFPKNHVDELQNIVERWCYFFKYAEETTEEDLKKLAAKAPILKLAYAELDKFRWGEKDLIAYEERILTLRKEEGILAQKLDDAREEGIKIGKEKGIKIGKEKGIKIGEEKGIKIGEEKGIKIGEEKGIKIGEEKGIKIGEEKGMKLEKMKVAKNLLQAGISIEIIGQTTGLTTDEIKGLVMNFI